MFRIGWALCQFSSAAKPAHGRIVMLRHGQSVWNDLNRWAGWTDVKLSEKGIREARQAGEVLKQENFHPDVAYTSVMSRTIQTLNYIADVLDCHFIPVTKSWRLNEKHYGQLQGKNRSEVVQQHGQAQVKLWRRSYDVAPPALELSDPRHPINDRRYKDIDPALLPTTESLKDTIERVQPIWRKDISQQIKRGRSVLLVAHGNTLRSIIKVLDGITDKGIAVFYKDILELNIPTATPIMYEFDRSLNVLSKRYLGNAEEIRRKAEQVKNQGSLSPKAVA